MGDESAYLEFRTVKDSPRDHMTNDQWYQYMADLTFDAVEDLGTDMFPDYLWTPMQNSFEDDDYISRAIILESSSPEIRTLRHKYPSYYDWAEAMDIYNDELQRLVEIYGSKAWVKVGLREKIIPAVLPRKPVLKNSKKNRKLLQIGAPPIKPDPPKFTPEQFREIYDAYTPIEEDISEMDDEEFEADINKMPKKQRKQIISIFEHQIISFRKQGIYKRNGGTMFGLDAIANFMSSTTVYKYDSKGEYQEDKSLVELMADQDKYMFWQEEVIEDREAGSKPVTYINGRFTDLHTAELTELYSYLMDQGYYVEINKGFAKRTGLPKTAVRMLERKLGSRTAGPMSKDELKRLKKEQKKAVKMEKKRQQAEYDAARIMSQALNNGSTLFRDPDGELISLSDRLRNWE